MEHNEELVSIVIDKFKAGQSKAKIEESLMNEGWFPEDIERAIAHIKKSALRQLPILAPFLKYKDSLEEAAADLSLGKQILIMVGVGIFVLLIGVGLYVRFDPLNTKTKGDGIPVSSQTSPLMPEEIVVTQPSEQPTTTVSP